MKKKNQQFAPPGFEPAPRLPPSPNGRPYGTGPSDYCRDYHGKLMVQKYFSLPFTPFEPCGAVFIMNSKIHLRKNSLNEYFKAIPHSLRVYSLSGFTTAVLSVSNLSRQGIPATCRVGHCCVCSPLLFASERLRDSPGNLACVASAWKQWAQERTDPSACHAVTGDSPKYNKQRMNKISHSRWLTSCVAQKPKMHDDIIELVYGLLLGNCGYQTDRKKDL